MIHSLIIESHHISELHRESYLVELTARETVTSVEVRPILAFEKELAIALIGSGLMNGGHIVTVEPRVPVAIDQLVCHVTGQHLFSAIPACGALVVGALVSGHIAGPRLGADQLLAQPAGLPFIVA